MTLDATARIQANSGTVSGSGFTATLPNPAMDGSTLLLFFVSNGGTPALPAVDPPWLQDGSVAGNWWMWRRDGQPAGETSWAVTAPSPNVYMWRVEEWAGLATIGQPAGAANHLNTFGAAALDTGTATSTVDDFAALALWRAGSGGGALFPAGRSYPAGWSEVSYVTQGDGSTSGDFLLVTAEAYPGAAGSVAPVLTWDTSGGGSFANLTGHGAVACYQPAGVPPPRGVLAVPG